VLFRFGLVTLLDVLRLDRDSERFGLFGVDYREAAEFGALPPLLAVMLFP
jgi:hypothetical protein